MVFEFSKLSMKKTMYMCVHKEKEEDEEVEVEGALLSPMTRKQRVTVETTMR